MWRKGFAVVIVGMLAAATATAAPPATVSPGRTDLVVEIATRCPTFSWGFVPGAAALRVEVWAVAEEEASQATRVVAVELAGNATSWTPWVGRCLAPGITYAWRVGVPGEGDAVEWSEAAWFSVAPEVGVAPGSGPAAPGAGGGGALARPVNGEAEGAGDGAPAAAGRPLPAHARAASFFSVGTGGAVSAGPVVAQSFAGDGAGLTNLDAGQLASGTVAAARLSGTYAIDVSGTAANVTGIVAVGHGGTGADNAADARANLGAAATAHTHAGSEIGGLAVGGVTFGGGGGALAQDAANLFWDESARRLGLGTSTPTEQLELTGNLRLPVTTASEGTPEGGVLFLGGEPFLHGYAKPGSELQNTFLGYQAGNFTMGGAEPEEGNENTAVGFRALTANTTGRANVAVGTIALQGNTTGNSNVAVGVGALAGNGSENVAVGRRALSDNTSGERNVAVGFGALGRNTEGVENIAIGYKALEGNATGTHNTAIGSFALFMSSPTGSGNTVVGGLAGFQATGSNNVFLGASAGFDETASHRLHIANNFERTLIYGEFDEGQVLVNRTAAKESATATLDVNGDLRVRGWEGSGDEGVCRDTEGVLRPCSAAGSGVVSFNGRTGAVTAQSGDYAAAQVTNAPAGNIAATDVQGAIAELDAEKAPLAHTHAGSDITSAVAQATDADTLDGLHASAFVQGETVLVIDEDFDTRPTEFGLSTVWWQTSASGMGSVHQNYEGVLALESGLGGGGTATLRGVQQFSLADATLIMKAVVMAYADGWVWGDYQPRGFATGTDRANAIEFISVSPTSVACRTVAGGAVTETTVGIDHSVYAKWTTYQIVASPSQVRFYVDGKLVATHTTNIPTTPLNLLFNTSYGGWANVPLYLNHVTLERRW